MASQLNAGETNDGVPTALERYESQKAALIREREGYARAGKKDRVKAVDDEIKKLGKAPVDAEPEAEAEAVETATVEHDAETAELD